MAAADAVSPVPFFAFSFQQSIVGFDEFMKVQAEHDTLMFLW